jgi:hypothetical protein
VAGRDREVAEGDPQRRVAQARVCDGTARTGVVAVEHDERRGRIAAHMVGVTNRGRGRAAQVAHARRLLRGEARLVPNAGTRLALGRARPTAYGVATTRRVRNANTRRATCSKRS